MESNQGSNSVLFALGELRDIEDDRVRTQEEREVELEAERQRLQREREEMELQREEQRRFELELAERRASIEAQMKLEERRIALELERIPTPTLDTPSRPKWPWLMSVAVLALAGMQFLMWQMQRGLDRSIDDIRIAQEKMSWPRFIDERAPDPVPTLTTTPTVAPTPKPELEPNRVRPVKRGATPPKISDDRSKGIDCGNTEDPLGCMPR